MEVHKKGDRTEPKHKISVVYKIKCRGCEVAYVGQAQKSGVERAKQHRTNSRDHDRDCVINTHMKGFGHCFDFENPIVLFF